MSSSFAIASGRWEHKNMTGWNAPNTSRDPAQSRHDRIVHVTILVLLALIVALLVWLACLGNADRIDYSPIWL